MTLPSSFPLPRTLALVGLMGAGKSAIGRRLATRFGIPFVDADQEIEQAAGATVEDIFTRYGEPAFRDLERRVMARLLEQPVQVVATGGGAFMDEATRSLIRERGHSLWLRADLELLVQRTARRGNRPLLKTGDPRQILARLMEIRYPVYAEADMVVDSRDVPPESTVDLAQAAIADFLGVEPAAAEAGRDLPA